jgi:hypothetical protein
VFEAFDMTLTDSRNRSGRAKINIMEPG